jgi:hypothetical protein
MTVWSLQKWEMMTVKGINFRDNFGIGVPNRERQILRMELRWENGSGWLLYFMADFSVTGCRFSGCARGVLVYMKE